MPVFPEKREIMPVIAQKPQYLSPGSYDTLCSERKEVKAYVDYYILDPDARRVRKASRIRDQGRLGNYEDPAHSGISSGHSGRHGLRRTAEPRLPDPDRGRDHSPDQKIKSN